MNSRLLLVRAVNDGTPSKPLYMDCPTIEEDAAGIAFIETVMASPANNPAQRPLHGDATLNSDRDADGERAA